jgi:hypothetical protein
MQTTPANSGYVPTGVKFYCLTPAQIPSFFDREIIPRLVLMQKKTGDIIDFAWLYARLCDGDIKAWTAIKDGKIISIAITQEVYNSLTGDKGLSVLALHADKGLGLTKFLSDTFDEIAEFFEYRFLTAHTVRKGWVGAKYGWQLRGAVWGKDYVRR